MIAGFKKKTFAWTLIALALTLLVGCSALTGAKTGAPADTESPSSQEPANSQPANVGDEVKNDDNNSNTTPEPTPEATENTGDQNSGLIMTEINMIFTVGDPQGEDVSQKLKDGQTVIYDGHGKIAAYSFSEKQFIQFLLDDGTITKSNSDGKTSYSLGSTDIEQLVNKAVDYFVGRLKDKSYTGTYGEGFTWYTAAEELGKIGKPAIPSLIEKLKTTDDYERTLALYALLLATQQENVKTFTGGEYINVNLDFDTANHSAMVKTAMDWWEKYKSNF